jgi:hypothetical protein
MKIEQYDKINKNWLLYSNPSVSYGIVVKEIVDCMYKKQDELVLENMDEIKHFLNKIGSELKNATKFITTFGTGVAAFYPAVSRLLDNSLVTITKQETMLIIVTAISMLLRSQEAEKLKEKIREKGLIKSLYGVLNFVRNYSKFMATIRNKSADVASSLADMLGYTALLVPSITQIAKLINQEEISLDDTRRLFTGLVASASAYGIKTLINKAKDNKSNLNK